MMARKNPCEDEGVGDVCNCNTALRRRT